ncbi:MAG: hypothetical protein Q9227_004297 [Pyrenula ochraceoflavens]
MDQSRENFLHEFLKERFIRDAIEQAALEQFAEDVCNTDLFTKFLENRCSQDLDTGISVSSSVPSLTDSKFLEELYAEIRKRLSFGQQYRASKGDWNEAELESIDPQNTGYGWNPLTETIPLGTPAAQASLLENLKEAVVGAKANAVFCCGGSVLTPAEKPVESSDSPFVLHWDDKTLTSCHRLSLPPKESDASVIQKLYETCEPATYGLRGRDVYDSMFLVSFRSGKGNNMKHPASYRNAVKLDASQFTSNFHPYDYGIIDEIQRSLLPAFLGDDQQQNALTGLRAELYKLNWAAFYSDCEHEILPVSEGCRITLTYNLYFTKQPSPTDFVTSMSTLPFWHDLKGMLNQKDFFPSGGKIGFWCAHSYAHNVESHAALLPEALKGVDRVVYSVLVSLGLTTDLRPVIRGGRHDDDEDEDQLSYLGIVSSQSLSGADRHCRKMLLEAFSVYAETGDLVRLNKTLDDPELWQYAETDMKALGIRLARPSPFSGKLQALKKGRVVRGLKAPEGSKDYVGDEFHTVRFFDRGEEEEPKVSGMWESTATPGIHWVTESKHTELAVAYLAYGNEASLGWRYSSAAIIATLPPWSPGRGDVKDQKAGMGTLSLQTESSVVKK